VVLLSVLLAGVSATVAVGLGKRKRSERRIKSIAINAARIPKRRRRGCCPVGGGLPVPGPYEPAVPLWAG
jgi:hypothetical protein